MLYHHRSIASAPVLVIMIILILSPAWWSTLITYAYDVERPIPGYGSDIAAVAVAHNINAERYPQINKLSHKNQILAALSRGLAGVITVNICQPTLARHFGTSREDVSGSATRRWPFVHNVNH